MSYRLLILALLAMPMAPSAQEKPEGELPPPPMIEGGLDEELLEPQVEIIKREDRTIEEYRVNGRLYMVRITPDVGPSYYLIDADGDGTLEQRRHELDENQALPTWVLFRW